MDTTQSGPQDVAAAAVRSWRRHSAEFKARVIELARQPGTSMAAVALANGLNANMLRRWVHEAAVQWGNEDFGNQRCVGARELRAAADVCV